jgi:hypothetical protein
MCVAYIDLTDTYIEIGWCAQSYDDDAQKLHFEFSQFPPSANTNEKRKEHIIAHAQTWLDHIVNVADMAALYPDDPDFQSDPGLPWKFYQGSGGNTELVTRNYIIENVVYNDALTPPLSFQLRRIHP